MLSPTMHLKRALLACFLLSCSSTPDKSDDKGLTSVKQAVGPELEVCCA